MAKPLAALRNVSHTWPSSGTPACRGVSLNLRAGEVRALAGENGAGKTTLGHILAGVLRPETGLLEFQGRSINLSERRGRRGGLLDGIGLVRQRSIWPGSLELWEAAILGRERHSFSGGSPFGASKWPEEFTSTAREWGLEGLDPHRPVSRTDAATIQRAQLVAALMFRPELMILDEPASAWEEGRSEEFFGILGRLKSAGKALLLITHRIEDIFRVAESVTVMRQGTVVLEGPVKGLSQDDVTRAMFGRVVSGAEGASMKNPRPANADIGAPESSPRLSVRGLCLKSSGRDELKDVDFDLNAGEILAITGLRGEGLARLEDVVTGNLLPTSGTLRVNGIRAADGASGMREAGLHYIPSDVFGRGTSLGSTVAENMMVLQSRQLSVRGWLHPGRVRRWTEEHRRSGNIAGRPDQRLGELSGGNIQRVMLQRELNPDASLIVLADPTRGLDEMGRRRIHARVREMAANGTAILLLASDLEEALSLSDRMGVLSGGRLVRIAPSSEWNRIEAARLIAGRKAG